MIRRSSRSRRKLAERTSESRSCACPTLPECDDHELLGEITPAGPGIVLVVWREPLGVHPVRDHAQALRRSALLLQPLAHGVPDRYNPVGTTKVETDEPAQQAHHRRVPESIELHRDLREHVLADDDQRSSVASRDEQRDVGDDRRVGHTEDDVGTRATESAEERPRQICRVVRRPREDLRALE